MGFAVKDLRDGVDGLTDGFFEIILADLLGPDVHVVVLEIPDFAKLLGSAAKTAAGAAKNGKFFHGNTLLFIETCWRVESSAASKL